MSQDPVAIAEIVANEDMHEANRARFKLPERRVAKFFLFRLIYGGTAWAYAGDPNFMHVSTSPKYWQRVIDEAYDKYKILAETHTRWEAEVVRTGRLSVPTGREYLFVPFRTDRGELKWPRTQILNYPVQGLGHDLMALVRIELFKLLKRLSDPSIRLISTVHDSIDVDCPDVRITDVITCINMAFGSASKRFKDWFKVEFNLPLRCEVFTGKNLKDLTEIT